MERTVSVKSILHDFEKVLTAHQGEMTLYRNILDFSDNLDVLKENLKSWSRILNWLVCRFDALRQYQPDCLKLCTIVDEVVSDDHLVKLLLAVSSAESTDTVDEEINYLHAHLHLWIQSHHVSDKSPSPLNNRSLLSQRVPMCVIKGDFGNCSRSTLCSAVTEVARLFELDTKSGVDCSLEGVIPPFFGAAIRRNSCCHQ